MLRRTKYMLIAGYAAFLSPSAPAPGQLPSNSVPVFIADERLLIGRYHYEEKSDNFKIDVHLNADRSALYRITSGPKDSDFIKAEGFWTVEGDVIHIHNRPGSVRLDLVGAPALDSTVGIAIEASNVDGTSAEGLGVTWRDAPGLYAMSDGRHITRPTDKMSATKVCVLRLSDRKQLATFDYKPGSPNRFRFLYHPSDVEPFDIPAIALDSRAQELEVEVGTASAKLNKISG